MDVKANLESNRQLRFGFIIPFVPNTEISIYAVT